MEKYIRVSDIKKVCDPYRDWDVPQMTADEVAGIVRCRECKHWHKYDDFQVGSCGYYYDRWNERADDFCSRGERRES